MKYTLSKEAENDLDQIFDHTLHVHGASQAVNYFNSLIRSLDQLSQFPKMGMARDEFGKSIRSFLSGSHIIFYQIREKELLIVRVIHQSRDLPNMF